MVRLAKFKQILVVILFVTTSVSAAPTIATPEDLSLEKAIEKALSSNRDFLTAKLTMKSAEYSYEAAWHNMFMPTISLEASSTASNTVTQLSNTTAYETREAAYSHGYPSSALRLNLGSYTLFNSWIDRINYDKAQLGFTRAKENFVEAERNTRSSVIENYFKLRTEQEKEDAAKRSVEISSAILELVKAKQAAGTGTESDVSSSTVDLLNARNQFNEIQNTVRSQTWNFNQILGEPIDTPYRLTSDIKFKKMQLTEAEAVEIFKAHGPAMKDARLSVTNAQMDVELAEKGRFPLKVALSGITVEYSNGYYGGGVSRTTTGVPSGNIDVSTSVSVSLPLFGPDGVFNRNTLANSRINREKAELAYQSTGNSNQASIYSSVGQIKYQEINIENSRQAFEASAALLDSLIANASSGKVSRLELRDAVQQARQNEISYKDLIRDHLVNKLTLAKTIGLDRLPGDIY